MVKALALFDQEHAQLLAAWEWLMAQPATSEYDDLVLTYASKILNAVSYYQQGLELAYQIDDRQRIAHTRWNPGLLYERQGYLTEAVTLLQVCVDFERTIEHPDAEQDAAYLEQLRCKLDSQHLNKVERRANGSLT